MVSLVSVVSVVSFRWFHSFRPFRFVVSGFSTCRLCEYYCEASESLHRSTNEFGKLEHTIKSHWLILGKFDEFT